MQSVPASSLVLPSASNKYSIRGRSRAGDGTTFVIPELKWMFDCGALIEGKGLRQPSIIWLTHTHSDHILTLAQICHSRRDGNAKKKKPLPIYLPAGALPFVRNYLNAYDAMITMGVEDDSEANYELIGVSPNEEINIRQAGKDFIVRVVECVHRVECVGYSIWEQQHKLKEEYKGLPGKEIGKLKKEGVAIATMEENPVLCYLGDTTIGVFDKHPEILNQHSTIVVECSFLDDDNVANARRTKHMHWSDLRPIVDDRKHSKTLFVLTHFSLRYSILSLRNFFIGHHNVHPMVVQSELLHEWQEKRQISSDNETNEQMGPPSCDCFVCTVNAKNEA